MKGALKESQQASFLEQRVSDFSKDIDKLAKDIDYEKKKNSKLSKENTNLRSENELLKKKLSGDNDPNILKSRLGESQNKLSVVNTTLTNKAKEIKDLEDSLSVRTKETKDVIKYAWTYLQVIMTWIDSAFLNPPQLDSDNEESEELNIKSEIPRIYETIPEILKAKKNSKSKNNLLGYLESLKEILHDSK